MKELEQFIVQLSSQAGDYLRNHFYTFKNVMSRDLRAFTSNVDLELMDILSQRIKASYPDHAIQIQGSGVVPSTSDYTWIIDPLDGSSHFSRNIPIYSVSIALKYKEDIILATVNHPQTHQLYFAIKDQGSYLNGIKINVSDQHDLSKAFIFVELPEKKFNQQKIDSKNFDQAMLTISRLVNHVEQVEIFRIGSFGQCLVASGAFDAYIDFSGSSEEISQIGSQLILKEAGAEIINLDTSSSGFVQIMATNAKLTKELNSIIYE